MWFARVKLQKPTNSLNPLQWLVFRNDGSTSAGQWAQDTAQYASKSGLLSVFDRGKEERQQAFVKEILRQTMKVRFCGPLVCRSASD